MLLEATKRFHLLQPGDTGWQRAQTQPFPLIEGPGVFVLAMATDLR